MSKANRSLKILILLSVITLVTSFPWSSWVRAQSTSLTILPASSTAPICGDSEDVIIKVRAQDVVDLYAYDVSISFTSSIPGAIEVLELSNAGFLDSGFVLKNVIDNTTGTLRYAMTQQSPSTAKTGMGDLISIRIRPLIPGATVNLVIGTTGATPSKLSAIGGVPIPFTTSDGGLTTTDACSHLIFICLITR
jgi:hypothetical protein